MKAFLDPRQRLHDPKMFLTSGLARPNPEQPARVDMLLSGADRAGCTVVLPDDHGMAPIARVHSAEYLDFLQKIYTRWRRMEAASDEVIPNIHPSRHGLTRPDGMVGQAGWHMADTACPIAEHTWQSAYWSAQSAVSAALCVAAGDSAYALCRPPGHHAFGDMAGGFCFLNNAAIAAEVLRHAGKRPAILDVDVHHGNGTQGVFYTDPGVLTLSIHADPARFYPFFWGHAQERGEGAGEGANLNLPLERGSGDDAFFAALDAALERITTFGADVVVVALGLDAHEGDPFAALKVTTDGFSQIAKRIAALGLPAALVQEGGYLQPELGDNLAAFLSGWQA